MEKKSAYLDLKGRRASTTPVLSENLAILVRDKPTHVIIFSIYLLVLGSV